MRWLLCSAVLASLTLSASLAGCRTDATVVVVSIPEGAGPARPAADQILIMVPYDRDSVIRELSAPWLASRPDTIPLARLLDSLQGAFARLAAATPTGRAAARAAVDRLQAPDGPLARLRAAQHAWQDSAYASYDSLTFLLVKRIARDPFADTTDAAGIARVRPSRSGPWWITATTWDANDPFSEWYWNLPLTGDTLRLTAANARHRRRF